MFRLTFRRLEVFIATVEAGGFSADAERLGISHPSISNHFRALERQVGCKLFVRRKRLGSNVIEQGRRFYERAIRSVREAGLLIRDLASKRAALKQHDSRCAPSACWPNSVATADLRLRAGRG
jgi:DNA-binding transcriptional LysR family regulator